MDVFNILTMNGCADFRCANMQMMINANTNYSLHI